MQQWPRVSYNTTAILLHVTNLTTYYNNLPTTHRATHTQSCTAILTELWHTVKQL